MKIQHIQILQNWKKIDITADNVRNFIAKYHKNRRIVNMERFIDETSDEVLDSLSEHMIDGLDWSNTKFKKF